MDLVDFVEAGAIDWIGRQRDRYRTAGVPLAPEYRSALQRHYSPAVLDSVRVARVGQIENPEFYVQLISAGYDIPLDFRQAEGITFGDVVVLRDRARGAVEEVSLRFHELVHVVQYDLLGVAGFGRRYVRGWAANGFDYSAIPLEVDAYQLQAAFDAGELFDVASEVQERLGVARS